MDSTKLLELAEQLAAVAAAYDPKDAAILSALLRIGAQLNSSIKAIKEQGEAVDPQVWEQVRSNFSDALSAFNTSVQNHQE